MNNITHPQQENGFDELRLFTRSLLFLALLPGLIYLRVFIVEIVPAMRVNGSSAMEFAKLVLLVVAMLGLLLTWWHEMVGGGTAVLAGFIFGILAYLTATENAFLLAFFYSSPFIISGGLSLVCWRREQHREVIHGA